jgi:hypothetical protein
MEVRRQNLWDDEEATNSNKQIKAESILVCIFFVSGLSTTVHDHLFGIGQFLTVGDVLGGVYKMPTGKGIS